MTYETFVASLGAAEPPTGISLVLQGLWYAGRQQWEQAHTLAQVTDRDQRHNWLHAYLHRREGDAANAAYWYRRAGRSAFSGSLADEWEQLVRAQPEIRR